MITGYECDVARKLEYYQKGYWSEKTLNDYWNEQVRNYPDHECVCDDLGVRLTFSQVDSRAAKLASWLDDVGVRNGDVVAFQLPPWAEFYVLYVACLKVGAVCSPISVTFNKQDLVYALNLVEAKAFLCPTFHHKTNFEEQIVSIVDQIPSLRRCAVAVYDKTCAARFAITFKEIWEIYDEYLEEPGSNSDEIALVLLTSGTTGRPKAALFTHNSLVFSAYTFIKRLHLSKKDVLFMPAPMNHATGFKFGLITPMLLGGRAVYQHKFNADSAISLINKEGVTWSMGATPFLHDLFNCAESQDLSFGSMRLYVCGGASVPSAMVKRAHGHNIALCECYGSTESSPHVIVPPEYYLEWNGLWSGIACEGIEVKVVDETGNEVEDGIQGEEISRGPQMFSGYYKNSEETSKSLTNDGWFYSGDLCCCDEKGRIRITGRKKEIIIRGGENISLNEVDECLTGCPGVGPHATVGLPDERMGERICTFIVQDGINPPTIDSIAKYLDSKGVAKRLRPERVEFIDEIPMTDSGKIKRHVLSDELKQRLM